MCGSARSARAQIMTDGEWLMDDEWMVQIDAPHYCAGMVSINGLVIDAAPILKWALGKRLEETLDYFRKKKYGIKICDKERGWVTIRLPQYG